MAFDPTQTAEFRAALEVAGALPTTLTGSDPFGDESLTVSTTAVGLASIPADASRAFLTVTAGTGEFLRFRVSGSAATGALGHKVTDGDNLVLDTAGQLSGFSIIRDAAATVDGSIFVTYF